MATQAAENKDFVIELNKWNYRAFKAFRKAVAEDNEEVFAPLLAVVVEEWPFDLPINSETVLELGLVDMATLLRAVNMAAENTFRAGNAG